MQLISMMFIDKNRAPIDAISGLKVRQLTRLANIDVYYSFFTIGAQRCEKVGTSQSNQMTMWVAVFKKV